MSVRRLARACAPLALLVLALGSAPTAAAQSVPLHDLLSWTTFANGDEVLAEAVSPVDGRLWVGTEGGGLVVWDADRRTFEQFLFPNSRGLLSNTVYDIAFDARTGDAWLATAMGVAFVDHATMSFRTTVADTDEARPTHSGDVIDVVGTDRFPDSRIFNAVAVADDGTVWVGTPDRGVAVRGLDGQWTRYAYDDANPELGPQRETVSDIAALPDGTIWVAHGRGEIDPFVSVFDPATGEWKGLASSGPTGNVADGPRTAQAIQLAVERSPGGGFFVWCATWNRGVYRWDPQDGTWTEYTERSTRVAGDASSGLCNDTVWAIAVRAGYVWAACISTSPSAGRGVSRLDPNSGVWRHFSRADGLPSDIVTAIAISEDGTAYLGTDEPPQLTRGGNGVAPMRIDGATAQVGAILSTSGITPYVNEITAMAWDAAGNLWVGTRQSGVMRLDRQTATWTHYTQASTANRLAGDAVTGIVMIGDEVWVSSAHERYQGGDWIDGGLSVFDRTSNTWSRVFRPDNTAMASSQVGSLAADGVGQLWLGYGIGNSVPGGPVSADVQQGRGVDVMTAKTGIVSVNHNMGGTGGALAGNTVLGLAIRGLDVWAATSYGQDDNGDRVGGGMSRWDGHTWRAWRTGDDGLTSYMDSGITGDMRSVFIEPNGVVWAGTYTGDKSDVVTLWPLVTAAINRFDPGSQTWTAATFPMQGWISAITVDALDQVWLGTTRGHMQEVWRGDGIGGEEVDNPQVRDLAVGGLQVAPASQMGTWDNLTPSNSGLAAIAITSLSIEPATGFVWVGTEDGGLAVYSNGVPLGPSPTPPPTNTPCASGANCPTVTPIPSRTLTHTPPPVVTAPSPGPGTAQSTAVGLGSNGSGGNSADGSDSDPTPPPEVPEAGTWLLLVTGVAAIGGFAWWRQRKTAATDRR
ncbi:MAG: two-component regulator propeller domain-containing protein [Ardenticatenales bacterium]